MRAKPAQMVFIWNVGWPGVISEMAMQQTAGNAQTGIAFAAY